MVSRARHTLQKLGVFAPLFVMSAGGDDGRTLVQLRWTKVGMVVTGRCAALASRRVLLTAEIW